METISLYERKDDKRLVIVEENKSSSPKNKKILLTEDPWVSIQGEGRWTGQHFCFIRVSYCPLSCKFCDIKESWTDKNKEGMTIEELTSWAKNKSPRRVCLTGGEPMFKYDEEIRHLVSSLHDVGKIVHFETSGICIPNTLIELLETWVPSAEEFSYCPDFVCVSPKYRDCVPEREHGPYMIYMIEQMKFWRDMINSGIVDGEWKFVVNCDDMDSEIAHIIWLLGEIYEDQGYDGVRINFQPETREELYSSAFSERTPEMYHRYLLDWAKLTEAVGSYLPNFSGAEVHITSQTHQLLEYR